jgi:hypothetical protein
MLYRMIYSSEASEHIGPSDLSEILDDARVGNEARNVTGVLVYVDGVFCQVLEGEREVLEVLTESIRRDARHKSMKVFHRSEVMLRTFDDWRMAYVDANAADMSRWAGLEGTVTIDQLLERLHNDVARIPKILVHIVEAVAEQSGKA